jgi:hypothetical protein
MFESGSKFQPHWTSYGENKILDPIQNSADLTVYRIGRIATFPLDSIMYAGMELAFNQEHQTLYVPRCVNIMVAAGGIYLHV